MRHYAKSNPFSNFLWIKDELLWNHSRHSCQNELVQQSFLGMIFHDSFATTRAAKGMQELSPWIPFFVILVSLIISAYCISDTKVRKRKKVFTLLTFDKYLLMETFKKQYLCEWENWGDWILPTLVCWDSLLLWVFWHAGFFVCLLVFCLVFFIFMALLFPTCTTWVFSYFWHSVKLV